MGRSRGFLFLNTVCPGAKQNQLPLLVQKQWMSQTSLCYFHHLLPLFLLPYSISFSPMPTPPPVLFPPLLVYPPSFRILIIPSFAYPSFISPLLFSHLSILFCPSLTFPPNIPLCNRHIYLIFKQYQTQGCVIVVNMSSAVIICGMRLNSRTLLQLPDSTTRSVMLC